MVRAGTGEHRSKTRPVSRQADCGRQLSKEHDQQDYDVSRLLPTALDPIPELFREQPAYGASSDHGSNYEVTQSRIAQRIPRGGPL